MCLCVFDQAVWLKNVLYCSGAGKGVVLVAWCSVADFTSCMIDNCTAKRHTVHLHLHLLTII